jgi:Mor family transcriptional regulator
MCLVERYGGLRIYIPRHATPEHHFSQVIGCENLAKLAQEYGGDTHFQLPKAQRSFVALRDEAIRAAYGTMSVRQLAADYRLTERHICRIVSLGANNELQDSLFE